ncbi:MAG: S41 family peptidase [Acidobacteria bacterium]|nr:S41 family peptidase [Acidobacteriota bacterium]
MDRSSQRGRTVLVVPLVIALSAVLGGYLGPPVEGAADKGADDISASVSSFSRVFSVVEQNFADPLDHDEAIYKGAIVGMLRTLDPHSAFFDPRAFQLLREDQKGHYFGVGMSIGPSRTVSGRTIVLTPFPGSPAYRAGIRPGDAILAVNGKSADNLRLDEIADLLKGPKGTTVKVSIGREGSDHPLVFDLTRDEIPRKSVQDAFWLKPGIAYVGISQFNENTSREVEEAFRRLGEHKIGGLILDLRSNPGGLLNEGVIVADRFLRKGQVIVSHRGRISAEKPYTARQGGGGRDYPIVAMVDRISASAAEIVAGALQDHDRGWIFGERTFGKGLVQTVYPLREGTGLALTTAHYYTPSGRLIQRDYSQTSFLAYYYPNKDTDPTNSLDVKMTDAGRTVYGGGGITPDEKYTTPQLNRFQSLLLRRFAFSGFTAKYFGTHEVKLTKDWAPDHSLVNEFHGYLLEHKYEFTESDFALNHDWIRQSVRREFFLSGFSVDEAIRLSIETDPAVAKAMESLPKAKALLENAKKVIAQRVAK